MSKEEEIILMYAEEFLTEKEIATALKLPIWEVEKILIKNNLKEDK